MGLRFRDINEAEQWVLQWGAHATVNQPEELRTRVAGTALALARRYGTGREEVYDAPEEETPALPQLALTALAGPGLVIQEAEIPEFAAA